MDDRIVSLDLMAAVLMAQVILLVFTSGYQSWLDLATAAAVISFLATVSLAKYQETSREGE